MNVYEDPKDIDLYQARMLIAFHRSNISSTIGTMEAFIRRLPPKRKFIVVCGIERIVNYIKGLKITNNDIEILRLILPEIEFTEDLCNYITSLDFSSLEIRAMNEGQIAFENEPIISIRGPIGMVQFVEKKILSILNHDVRIASKAVRIAIAARGKPVAEFGGRRGGDNMSAEAGRAAYIGGFSSTSNVLCFIKYGVPCIGTMGHVWVMAHDNEEDAYTEWSRQFPNSVYLPDTYNVYNGVEKIIKNCKNIGGIRFDSGDILQNSIVVRRELDAHGLRNTTLGATDDLNEYKINALLNAGAPIDWFGVGTEVVSTPDSPSCGFIFKLVEIERNGNSSLVAKIAAEGKGTLPGAKQVFRFSAPNHKGIHCYTHDVLGLANESHTFGLPLLNNVSLTEQDYRPLSAGAVRGREYLKAQLNKMPEGLLIIDDGHYSYPVKISDDLSSANSKFISENSSKSVWGRKNS